METNSELNLNESGNLKLPPHSLEAEESALGSMMLSKEAITSSIEILKIEDFYQDAHRKIYDAILNIYNRNEPADVITIAEELKKTDSLEEVGGITY
ncbi:replicative DNA helicase, partial [Klebsiella pneumoniae]